MSIVVTKNKKLYKIILQKIPGIDYAEDILDMQLLLNNDDGCNMLILDESSLTKEEIEPIIRSIIKSQPFIKYILIITPESNLPTDKAFEYKKQLDRARYSTSITDINFFKETA